MKTFAAFLICALLLLFSLPAYAEIYKWTDENGTVHFTEDPSTIPEKYRGKVKSRETAEDGMTIEQRRQENKRNEAEAARRQQKGQAEYQRSIKEEETRIQDRQLRKQADEKRLIAEQQEKARRQRETQIENKPEYTTVGCQACLSRGQIRCYNCKGTGYDSALRRRCPFCDGAGWKRCSDCNGKGIIVKRVR